MHLDFFNGNSYNGLLWDTDNVLTMVRLHHCQPFASQGVDTNNFNVTIQERHSQQSTGRNGK